MKTVESLLKGLLAYFNKEGRYPLPETGYTEGRLIIAKCS